MRQPMTSLGYDLIRAGTLRELQANTLKTGGVEYVTAHAIHKWSTLDSRGADTAGECTVVSQQKTLALSFQEQIF